MAFTFWYLEYLNIKTQNKLVISHQNFQVIVNNLNNAIISEKTKKNFGYCNELGLSLIRNIWSQENAAVDDTEMTEHLDKLKCMDQHTENTDQAISDYLFTRELKIKEVKIFKIYNFKGTGNGKSATTNTSQQENTDNSNNLYSLQDLFIMDNNWIESKVF